MAAREAVTNSPGGSDAETLDCRAVDLRELSDITERGAAAAAVVVALDLDERLARAEASGRALERVGGTIVDAAVREVGQPRRFAERELRTARDLIVALPALAEPLRPVPVPAASGRTLLEWQPFGVVLGWHAANSPVWVPTLVALSGLAAGNAVISRPSQRARETTRLVVEALAEPWPTDALLMIDAPSEQALPLLWHDRVDAVVAHGSTETCRRHLAALGAAYAEGARLRPYIPEASGNDALLVLRGADLVRAAQAVALAGFANGGQLCMAAKRIIVERDVWAAFRPLVAEAVTALRVGAADDPATDVAPLSSGRAYDRAVASYDDALRAGGTVVVGEGMSDGTMTPTIVELPDHALSTALWVEESFAPLRGLTVVDDRESAVRLANDSRYGLGVAIFGGDEDTVARLRAARVVVDESPLYSDPHLVVGGIRDSGFAGARPKIEQLAWGRRVHRAVAD